MYIFLKNSSSISSLFFWLLFDFIFIFFFYFFFNLVPHYLVSFYFCNKLSLRLLIVIYPFFLIELCFQFHPLMLDFDLFLLDFFIFLIAIYFILDHFLLFLSSNFILWYFSLLHYFLGFLFYSVSLELMTKVVSFSN
jgi:hypothetical protein